MIKKLSIIALSVMGIAVAGCSNQAKTDTDSEPKNEKVTKNNKNSDSKKTTDTTTKDKSADSKDSTTNESTSSNSSSQTNNSVDNQNNSSQTNSNSETNDTAKSGDTTNKPTTSNNKVTSGDEAVTYLFSKLTNIDKTKVSGLYNGTVYDIDGKSTYRVNLYKKGEPQPYTAYNVYTDGTYTQVW